MTLSEKLKLLATWRGAQPGPTTTNLWDLRGGVLALLNDIDRELNYANPGRGIDFLLGTVDCPVNLQDDRPIRRAA